MATGVRETWALPCVLRASLVDACESGVCCRGARKHHLPVRCARRSHDLRRCPLNRAPTAIHSARDRLAHLCFFLRLEPLPQCVLQA